MSFDAKKYEQLSAYLDGELSAAERADVERLLAKDAEARACLDELRRISGMVATLPRGRAPGNMADAIIARVERESLIGEVAPDSIMRIGRWSRPFAIAASLLIVATVAIYTIPQFQTVSRPPAIELADAKNEDVFKKNDVGNEGFARTESKDTATDSGEAVGLRRSASREDVVALAEKKPMDMPVAPSATHQPAPNVSIEGGVGGGRTTFRGSGGATLEDKALATGAAAKESPGQQAEVAYALGGLDSKGTVNSPVTIGPPTEVRDSNIDSLIAANNVRNVQLQYAPVEAFDNQLRVEVDDPAMVAQLGTLIETNMKSQSAANLVKAPPESNVAANQTFWTSRDGATTSKQREIAGDEENLSFDPPRATDDGERVYVVNVPVDQAAPLLTSMQNFVESNQAVALWTANRMPVSQGRLAEEAIGNFNSQASQSKISLDSGSCSNAAADAKKSALPTGKMKDDAIGQEPKAEPAIGSVTEKPMSIEADTRKAGQPGGRKRDADEEAPEERQTAAETTKLGEPTGGVTTLPKTARPDGGLFGDDAMGPSATQPTLQSANAGYITMAISLRSNPMLRNLRSQSQSNSVVPGSTSGTNASQPAVISAPPTPTSQPVPTTQGASRG